MRFVRKAADDDPRKSFALRSPMRSDRPRRALRRVDATEACLYR
jgi:hypothetical protein